jgi:antitoxin Phd
MYRAWQLQEAKSKFSELVDLAISKGPQLITKRGLDSVIVLSVDEYNKLKKPKQSLIQFFNSAPKVDLKITRSKDLGRDVEL